MFFFDLFDFNVSNFKNNDIFDCHPVIFYKMIDSPI